MRNDDETKYSQMRNLFGVRFVCGTESFRTHHDLYSMVSRVYLHFIWCDCAALVGCASSVRLQFTHGRIVVSLLCQYRMNDHQVAAHIPIAMI